MNLPQIYAVLVKSIQSHSLVSLKLSSFCLAQIQYVGRAFRQGSTKMRNASSALLAKKSYLFQKGWSNLWAREKSDHGMKDLLSCVISIKTCQCRTIATDIKCSCASGALSMIIMTTKQTALRSIWKGVSLHSIKSRKDAFTLKQGRYKNFSSLLLLLLIRDQLPWLPPISSSSQGKSIRTLPQKCLTPPPTPLQKKSLSSPFL